MVFKSTLKLPGPHGNGNKAPVTSRFDGNRVIIVCADLAISFE